MKKLKISEHLRLLTLLFVFQNCSPTGNSESATENSGQAYYTIDDFISVEKIDAHVHIREEIDTIFIKHAEEDNFHLLTINVYSASGLQIEE